jgi:hypothetical protein
MNQKTDFVALLAGLDRAGVEYVVVGGIAVVSQGTPLTTFDLDIVPKGDPDNLARLLGYLRSVHAHHRGRPAGQVLEPTAADLEARGHCLLMTDLGALDVLGRIEEGLDYQALLPHTRKIALQGQPVRILSLAKIAELKSRSPREKDRLAAALIKQTLLRQSKAEK